MRLPVPALIPALALAALAGCGDARPLATGQAQGQSGCSLCHGSAANAAPPKALNGDTDTAARGVGAHQSHVTDGVLHKAFGCIECHPTPDRPTSPGHADGTVDVRFGALAATGPATPVWSGATCASVYCHGATIAGGSKKTPTWTSVGTGEAACGTCHGVPPPNATHTGVPANATACAGCHPATVLASGQIDVGGGKHVNGTIDTTGGHPAGWSAAAQHGAAAKGLDAGYPQAVESCKACHGNDLSGGTAGVACASCHVAGGSAPAFSCNFCHGTRGGTGLASAAPPLGLRGETLASQPAVGAHQKHLSVVTLTAGCSECHTAPSGLLHANGVVEIPFGTLARSGGAPPSYAAGSCSATYCHGGIAGGSTPAPAWTGAAMACTSCHGIPPPTGRHGIAQHQGIACGICHGSGYSASAVAAATHVDGTRNVASSATVGWNPATRSCTNACHGGATEGPW